jgi:hypothetical protein
MSCDPVPSTLIFVEAGDALLMYASPDAATSCPHLAKFEERAALIAYGSCGEPYRVHHAGGRLAFEKSDQPARPDALKQLLLCYFEACEDPADADEPLDELVARAWTIECDYRRRCGSEEEIERRKMPLWGHVILIAVPLLALYWALHHR